jgi:hypothetical protein
VAAQEWLGKLGQKFQSNSPDDELARGMVATCTMLMGDISNAIEVASEDPNNINPLILAMAIQMLEAALKALVMLDTISEFGARLYPKKAPEDEQ